MKIHNCHLSIQKAFLTMSIFHVVVLVAAFVQAVATLQVGSISYWDKSSDYDSLPGNGLALINPNNGILSADKATIASFAKIIKKLKSSKPAVTLLGYIATGYGDRTKQPFKTIANQVKSYFKNYPQLDGIFFDEVGYRNDDCKKAKTDVDALRKIVTGVKSNVVITWNPGWVGSNWCYIDIANKGEIVMDFESDITTYMSTSTSNDLTAALSKARSRGVLVILCQCYQVPCMHYYIFADLARCTYCKDYRRHESCRP